MAWEFKGSCKVQGVSHRKGSKPGSSQQVVVSLLIPDVDCATAGRILGKNVSAKKVQESYFRANEGLDTLYDEGLKLTSPAHFDNMHAIKFADRDAVQVKRMNAFLLIPRAGGVFEVECRVAISDPPKGLGDDLGSCIHTSLPFELLSSELQLEGGETTPEGERSVSQRGKTSRKVH